MNENEPSTVMLHDGEVVTPAALARAALFQHELAIRAQKEAEESLAVARRACETARKWEQEAAMWKKMAWRFENLTVRWGAAHLGHLNSCEAQRLKAVVFGALAGLCIGATAGLLFGFWKWGLP